MESMQMGIQDPRHAKGCSLKVRLIQYSIGCCLVRYWSHEQVQIIWVWLS